MNVKREDILILCKRCHYAIQRGMKRCNCGRYYKPYFNKLNRNLKFCLSCTILKDKKFRKRYRIMVCPENNIPHIHWEFDKVVRKHELIWDGACGECHLSFNIRDFPIFPDLPSYCFGPGCDVQMYYPNHIPPKSHKPHKDFKYLFSFL